MRDRLARRVLYIEDNASNAALVTRALLSLPWMELVVARCGSEGLAELAASRFDLLLLDLHLPDIGGEELLRRLRSDEATAALPVVVISADASPEVITRLRAAGADDYLTKPVNIGHLVSVVDRRSAGRSPTDGPAAIPSPADRQSSHRVAIDVLDRGVLDDLRVLDDYEPGTLREVVELFATAGAERVAAMEATDATTDPDLSALAGLAHILRGSGANLGAVDLATQCRALAGFRRRDDGELVRTQVERVRRSFEAAVAELRDHLASDDERRAADADGGLEASEGPTGQDLRHQPEEDRDVDRLGHRAEGAGRPEGG